MWSKVAILSLLLAVLKVRATEDTIEYGVDVSFPMHHEVVTNNYPWMPWNINPAVPIPDEFQGMPIQPLGDRQSFYESFMQGCIEYHGEEHGMRCLEEEKLRMEVIRTQPKGVANFTETGYTKIKAPENLFKLIQEFWEKHKHNQQIESFGIGITTINYWEEPSYVASIQHTSEEEGGGEKMVYHISAALRRLVSAWTGQHVMECGFYGIRTYKEGAVLAPHIDALPRVSSVIINVDQDVDEPWPLEVIGHDGKAVNITMVLGDMVFYESHSIIHGRPFPLKGQFMANLFIHYEPLCGLEDKPNFEAEHPVYLLPGTEIEKRWRQSKLRMPHFWYPKEFQRKLRHLEKKYAELTTEVHKAAGMKIPNALKRALEKEPESINARDSNGWMPLHEAVRVGDLNAVKVLIKHGADINGRTMDFENRETGGTVLWWAQQELGSSHDVVTHLRFLGAKDIAPGLQVEF